MKAIRDDYVSEENEAHYAVPIRRQRLPTWVHGVLIGVVTVTMLPVVFWAVLITVLAPEPYPGATKIAKFWRSFWIVFVIKIAFAFAFRVSGGY